MVLYLVLYDFSYHPIFCTNHLHNSSWVEPTYLLPTFITQIFKHSSLQHFKKQITPKVDSHSHHPLLHLLLRCCLGCENDSPHDLALVDCHSDCAKNCFERSSWQCLPWISYHLWWCCHCDYEDACLHFGP